MWEKMEKGWGKTLNGTIGRGDSHEGKKIWGGGGISTLQVSMSFLKVTSSLKTNDN